MPSLRPVIINSLVQIFQIEADTIGSQFNTVGLKRENVRSTIVAMDLGHIRRRKLPLVEIIDDSETERKALIGQKTSQYRLEPIIRVVFTISEQNDDDDDEENAAHTQTEAIIEALKQLHIANFSLADGSALWHMPQIQTIATDQETLVQIITQNIIMVNDQEIFI